MPLAFELHFQTRSERIRSRHRLILPTLSLFRVLSILMLENAFFFEPRHIPVTFKVLEACFRYTKHDHPVRVTVLGQMALLRKPS